MTARICLESLNLAELNVLLAHLRLGVGHLKKLLSVEQLDNLFRLGSLDYDQLIAVSSNRIEQSGNVALVLNTVITSIFGAWMGYSGFMGLHLNSFFMLGSITSLTILTSTTVGFFSFRLTTQNARDALYNQRISNLCHHVLNLIITKEKQTIASLTKLLNNSLYYVKNKTYLVYFEKSLSKNFYDFEENSDYSKWLSELSTVIETKADIINKDEIYQFYSLRLIKTLKKINEIIELSYLVNLPSSESLQVRQGAHWFAGDNSFIKLLTYEGEVTPHQTLRKNWLRSNYLALLAGIVPTLLGGFASMFVFLAGGPNLANELGLTHLEHALRNSNARLIEFSIAVLLTAYYGASFIYNNYKSYVRDHEIEKTKKRISELEKEDIFLKRRISILKKIRNQTRRLINIYTAIENIDLFRNKFKDSIPETAIDSPKLGETVE